MPALIAEAPARAAIAKAIENQSRVLRAELGATARRAKRGPVHRLRVATRRLLAALELAAATGSAVPPLAPRRLEKLLELLSPLRDAQVMERGLQRLPEHERQPAIVKRARRARKRELERTTQRVARFDASELSELLAKVGAAVAGGMSESAAPLGELALTGHLAEQQLAIELGRAGARQASPHDLHQLRLLLKSYRYSLEILAEQLSPAAQGLLELTSTLQDELGQAHDREVLAKRVAQYAESHGGKPTRRLAESLARASRDSHASAAERVASVELPWPLGPEPPRELSRTKSVP